MTCVLLGVATLLTACNLAPNHKPKGYYQRLEQQGIVFLVKASNDGSLNQLEIIPKGLEIDNSAIQRTIDGSVTGAETADLNRDGSPEIYVYVHSAGSGSYGTLIAYSANNNKSLSDIYLPPLRHDEVNSVGYMGHDQFSVTADRLLRSFPVYLEGDPNAHPSGGKRQLEYRLIPGEAGWRLELVNSISSGP